MTGHRTFLSAQAIIMLTVFLLGASGCVARTAAGAAGSVVKTGVGAAGDAAETGVDLATPDGGKEKD